SERQYDRHAKAAQPRDLTVGFEPTFQELGSEQQRWDVAKNREAPVTWNGLEPTIFRRRRKLAPSELPVKQSASGYRSTLAGKPFRPSMRIFHMPAGSNYSHLRSPAFTMTPIPGWSPARNQLLSLP